MTTLRVIEPGFRSTIQDRGRTGHLRIAIPPAGPADPLELEILQRLVGNAPDDAGIEIVGLPFRFSLGAPRIVAAGGRDVYLRTRGPIARRTAAFVRASEEVVVRGSERTRFAYLAVSGGIAVPPVLGSRASYVPAGIGHPPLRSGDVLPLGPPRAGPERAGLTARFVPRPGRVRVTAGPHRARFSAEAVAEFQAARWRVGERSDRMGVRLEGPPIVVAPGEILSVGVVVGAVQVPHGGAPIVLLADHQATGGYAVIATVIAADLGVVAQTAPGEEISFNTVDRDAAVAALREERRWLEAMA